MKSSISVRQCRSPDLDILLYKSGPTLSLRVTNSKLTVRRHLPFRRSLQQEQGLEFSLLQPVSFPSQQRAVDHLDSLHKGSLLHVDIQDFRAAYTSRVGPRTILLLLIFGLSPKSQWSNMRLTRENHLKPLSLMSAEKSQSEWSGAIHHSCPQSSSA